MRVVAETQPLSCMSVPGYFTSDRAVGESLRTFGGSLTRRASFSETWLQRDDRLRAAAWPSYTASSSKRENQGQGAVFRFAERDEREASDERDDVLRPTPASRQRVEGLEARDREQHVHDVLDRHRGRQTALLRDSLDEHGQTPPPPLGANVLVWIATGVYFVPEILRFMKMLALASIGQG